MPSEEGDLHVFRMPDGLRLYRGRSLLARGDSDVLLYLIAAPDVSAADCRRLYAAATSLLG